MSGVWVFENNGVMRLVENPAREQSSTARRKGLLYTPSNEVISSYTSLERKLMNLGWERYYDDPDLIQFHKRSSVDLISLPKDFKGFKSIHMYDIVVKNREVFRVIDVYLLPTQHRDQGYSSSRANPNPRFPMAEPDPAPSQSSPPPAPSQSPPKKTDSQPIGSRIAELDQSQSELMERLQGLKLDLQNWRSNLDQQVKTYKDELLELKKVLNTDLEQLTSDFKELKTTLQKQQDDVTASLKNLGLHDASGQAKESEHQKVEENLEKAETLPDKTQDTNS
ncbi:hypothetical protein J5N97_015315 [Dioscorea zingiberensis]|uniref:Uncharacterized protein n=1 Tax=Dioscorea zingiberensis TaxID=325984 RepID=A0A9D5CUH0_9LILI|nr:hypothetical protein J5N97_015315 [Dioscorea zingiberensis]